MFTSFDTAIFAPLAHVLHWVGYLLCIEDAPTNAPSTSLDVSKSQMHCIGKIRQSMPITCAPIASYRNLWDPHCSYCAWSGICAGLMDNFVNTVGHWDWPKWKVLCILYLIIQYNHKVEIIKYYIKKRKPNNIYIYIRIYIYIIHMANVIYLYTLGVQKHWLDTQTSQQNSLTPLIGHRCLWKREISGAQQTLDDHSIVFWPRMTQVETTQLARLSNEPFTTIHIWYIFHRPESLFVAHFHQRSSHLFKYAWLADLRGNFAWLGCPNVTCSMSSASAILQHVAFNFQLCPTIFQRSLVLWSCRLLKRAQIRQHMSCVIISDYFW